MLVSKSGLIKVHLNGEKCGRLHTNEIELIAVFEEHRPDRSGGSNCFSFLYLISAMSSSGKMGVRNCLLLPDCTSIICLVMLHQRWWGRRENQEALKEEEDETTESG